MQKLTPKSCPPYSGKGCALEIRKKIMTLNFQPFWFGKRGLRKILPKKFGLKLSPGFEPGNMKDIHPII